jgi:hypothetical protein
MRNFGDIRPGIQAQIGNPGLPRLSIPVTGATTAVINYSDEGPVPPHCIVLPEATEKPSKQE